MSVNLIRDALKTDEIVSGVIAVMLLFAGGLLYQFDPTGKSMSG